MINVIDSIWFGTIGIVAINSDDHGWKAYIGQGHGFDMSADEQLIADTGMPVGKDIACAAFQGQDPDKFLH